MASKTNSKASEEWTFECDHFSFTWPCDNTHMSDVKVSLWEDEATDKERPEKKPTTATANWAKEFVPKLDRGAFAPVSLFSLVLDTQLACRMN